MSAERSVNMKILLIDDNQKLLQSIKEQLSQQHSVDGVTTGKDGLEKVQEIQYGVIILDLGLPDCTGLGLCQKIRAMNIATPIIVLTGTNDIATRVTLLDAGADDYLAKPFHIEELKARINALARRRPLHPKTYKIHYHDLVIDTEARQVFREGKHIPLRRKEYEILEYLVSHQGRIVTREMIINHIWDTTRTGWRSTVDVHVKHLRDKIDRPFKTKLIKTSYGMGYRVDAIDWKEERRIHTT